MEEEKIIKIDKEYANDSNRQNMPIFKGDVFFADLNPVVGFETGGVRPVVVIQNNIGNRYSPTIVAAITSNSNKKDMPTHVRVEAAESGLLPGSVVMLEQIRTIDKRRLREHMGRLDEKQMHEVDDAIAVSFGLPGSSRGLQ